MLKNTIVAALVAASFGACAEQRATGNAGPGPTITARSSERGSMGPLAGSESELVHATVAVHAIDLKTRELTVLNYENQLETFTVSDEVKRLNELKPGDKIAMSYIRALAFEVRKPTRTELEHPTIMGAQRGMRSLDLPPGMQATALRHTIVKVDDIDFKTKSVTLGLPNGTKVTAYARYPDNLYRVSVGDTVAVTYGEGVIVDVQPQA